MKRPKGAGVRGRPARFGPVNYIARELWRERGRNLLSFLSIAVLSVVLALFLSMNAGLEDYFKDNYGVPTDEEKELFEVKEVVSNWTSFMVFFCASLMVLSVANATSMDVLERRFELSTLRAIGMGMRHVLLLLIGPIAIVVFLGLLAGPSVLFITVASLGADPRLPLGPQLGIPLATDFMNVATVMAVGLGAALIGTVPSLISVIGPSPLEVLKDAP